MIIYRAPSAARVSRVAKAISLVPPTVLGACALKSTKLAALSVGLQCAVGAVATVQVAIPFAFYIFARRYVYEIEQADDTYKVKHLSPLMWTTRTTVARSADIAFPSQNEMLQSFSVGGRKFLWDRAFIADGDYNRMMRDARGIDFENAAYLNLQAETSATLKLVEDFAKKSNANEA